MQPDLADSSEPSAGTDIKTAIETITGDTGIVMIEYGGFVITVLDHSRFPWHDLFNFLIGESFEVWIDRKDPNLVIVAKQKLD